jgi:hypothetical protein
MRSRRVSEEELRRMFNDGKYYERMRAGEFHAQILRQSPVTRGDRQIRNSKSQFVEYRDTFGIVIARVHQYRMRDGSLGASGCPDPKLLRHEGVLYALEEEEQWDIPDW